MKKISKTESEWRKILPNDVYRVMRQKGTEKPYDNKYYHTQDEGLYKCAACGHTLFSSTDKYDSGSGWPSFCQPVETQNIIEKTDLSHFMIRTEVLCSQCESHLGHVFPDGPKPTGQRYCINSAALALEKRSSHKKG